MSLFAMTYILYTMYVVSAGGPIVLECKGEEYQACPMSYNSTKLMTRRQSALTVS